MKKSTNFLRQTVINGSKTAAIIMALLLTIGISSSFANTKEDIKGQVTASFKKDFRNAELMGYEVHAKFTKLTFRMNDVVLFAFYSDNGKLLAVIRNILSSQLPLDLMTGLKDYYSDYWISELFEINGDGQNAYYITLENADHKITLRSTDSVSWEVYQQANKE